MAETLAVRPDAQTGHSSFGALFREAGLTALVVLALAGTMVGFEVVDTSAGVELRTRFGEVAAAVVTAFIGRIAVVFARERRATALIIGGGAFGIVLLLLGNATMILPALGLGDGAWAASLKPFQNPVVDTTVSLLAFGFLGYGIWLKVRGGKEVAAAGRLSNTGFQVVRPAMPAFFLALAVAFPFLPYVDRQVLDIGVLVLTYVMLGWGLNVVVGLAGLLDLGYVAFFAVGAYTYALSAIHLGVGFWAALPIAGALAALAGVLLGFPVLRLRGDYLAIVTLGFGEIVRVILVNFASLTGGPNGLSGIPRPTFFGLVFEPPPDPIDPNAPEEEPDEEAIDATAMTGSQGEADGEAAPEATDPEVESNASTDEEGEAESGTRGEADVDAAAEGSAEETDAGGADVGGAEEAPGGAEEMSVDVPSQPEMPAVAVPQIAPEDTFHGYFGLTFDPYDRIVFMYFLILALALITNLFVNRLRRLPIGRAWEALREDEIACKALGISPRNTKLTAFSIGAMFAGFAGSFFATRQGFISPESFTFIESAVILAIVVLGGFGSQVGVVLASILLIGLPEFFRELKDFRMLAFGIAMVLIMLWRPAGLLSHRDPTLRLNPTKRPGAQV